MRRITMGSFFCGGEEVFYRLLAVEAEDLTERYGIEAEGLGESVSVPDITVSHSQILDLADRMLRGKVTPVAVRDVVMDFLLG